ncbi:MAG: AAA family ATPase [Christensenellaceae bacterium]|jgi:type II secretory pathway predicted ATPase ExeA|nr:AAA family ATPase [Christensenellaceae bacterium]
MLKEYYGFKKTPFNKYIPTSKLFLAESQEETLMRLNYVVNNKLFAIVTGECGTGKTTVLRKLKASLDGKKYDFLYVTDSKLTPRHFYNALLNQLGREGAFYRGDCRRKLHHEIELINGIRHRDLVIVVDEAHLLSQEMLEELRFLLNFRMDSVNPLSLILSGQSELEINLCKRVSAAISQRIDFRCRLLPMTPEETKAYINHHITIAGGKDPIFTDSAINEIYAYSAGTARVVCKLCYSCLMYGATKNIKIIEVSMVKDIIEVEYK